MSSLDNPAFERMLKLVSSGRFHREAERFRSLSEIKRLFPNGVDLDVGSPLEDELFAAALQAVTTAADLLLTLDGVLETPWRGDGRTFSDQVLLIAGGLWLHGPGGGEIHHRLTGNQSRMVECVTWQSLQGVIPNWEDAPAAPKRMVRGTLWAWSKQEFARPLLLRAATIAARMAMDINPKKPGDRFWPLPEVPPLSERDLIPRSLSFV